MKAKWRRARGVWECGLISLTLFATLSFLPSPAQAQWLQNEWRNFRAYPRLDMAYRLFAAHRYADARTLVEQVERIDPTNRNARVLKFRICEQQHDLACAQQLGKDWESIAPEDGLGPAMLAYVAYTERRDNDFLQLVQLALYRPGLSAHSKTVAGRAWVDVLFRLERADDAMAAISWLDTHKVIIAPADRRAWQVELGQDAAQARMAIPPSLRTPRTIDGSRAQDAAPDSAAKQAIPVKDVDARPSARVPSPVRLDQPRSVRIASPPHPTFTGGTAALHHPNNAPPVADLIASGSFAEAVAGIRDQEAAGNMTASTREGLVLELQARSCESVLDLVPDGQTGPLVTARQQLAAGYCSAEDPLRSARHFRAAISWGDQDDAIASQALVALASTEQAMGNTEAARHAASQAVQRDSNDAYIRATYGYILKESGDLASALHEFQAALSLDPGRVELLPEIAMLEQDLGMTRASARDFRSAIDSEAVIHKRLQLSSEGSEEQLYNWQRSVQMQEDRFGFTLSSNVRLDHGPNPLQPLEPVDYAQYSGTVDIGTSYRYAPLGASLPTWVIARASQQLEDASLNLVSGNVLAGIGVRQRLARRSVAFGSIEYVYRSSSEHEHDLMLRLSASRTWGGDWVPTGKRRWHYTTLYADAAWMVRERSYFVVLNGEWGPRYKLPLPALKAAFMPYVVGAFVADNGGQGQVDVNRLDLGFGLSILGWSGGNIYRAPPYAHRLSLEIRQVVAGNATDRQAIQLRWALLKM